MINGVSEIYQEVGDGLITIIDYGMGNVGSILNGIRKVGGLARVSADPKEIENAEAIILPGVGAFDTAMEALRDQGLLAALEICARERKRPLLGICLGLQILGHSSEEGRRPGLGWLDAHCVRFPSTVNQQILKVPHMGWNEVMRGNDSPLFHGLSDPMRFYFVHSYHMLAHRPEIVIGRTSYRGVVFDCAIQSGNIMGVQFHPEKSHHFGLAILSNFCDLIKNEGAA